MKLSREQLKRLGIEDYQRQSPLFERCCLRVCANASYSNAEKDLAELLGVSVSHSSLHRSVQRQVLDLPEVPAVINSISLDGGKVRLRSEGVGQSSYWRDYKAACLNQQWVGACFQRNLDLTDWIQMHRLATPVVCWGDGHPGIWNLFDEIATSQQRLEILDWFHLKENLFKVRCSPSHLAQAEADLWHGDSESVITRLSQLKSHRAQTFCRYLRQHQPRIVNYAYWQTMTLYPIPIGSGAVESAVKQIDMRLQLVGAQWKPDNVNQMLALRCRYLSGALDTA
jgi:hypothetical protein